MEKVGRAARGLQSNYNAVRRSVCEGVRAAIIMEIHGNASSN